MRYEDNYSDFVSLDLGQPKDVEVDGTFSMVVGQQLFNFSREKDVLLHEEKCHHKMVIHEENSHPFASSTCTFIIHKKSAEMCIFRAATYSELLRFRYLGVTPLFPPTCN